MGRIDVEELILDLADLVYEIRHLRKQTAELQEWQEEQRKRTNEMVQTNLQNTVDFLETLANKEG